jgi:hypothetical protein
MILCIKPLCRHFTLILWWSSVVHLLNECVFRAIHSNWIRYHFSHGAYATLPDGEHSRKVVSNNTPGHVLLSSKEEDLVG